MDSTNILFEKLLCLTSDWEVSSVDFNPVKQKVLVSVKFIGKKVICPVCEEKTTIADHAPKRTWRHLDTMQFETYIEAKVPRCDCQKCGVKTVKAPWADKHSRFTLMFESFSIKVMEACTTLSSAQNLTSLSWNSLNNIMNRAVERGLNRRSLENLKYLGIDEKQFRKGQSYISSINDLEKGRVLDVVDGRDSAASQKLLSQIPKEQRATVKAVAMDMWKAFITEVEKTLPKAKIVHDKFHISKYLNDAVDKVRKQENDKLIKKGDKTLVGSKYLWLYNDSQRETILDLKFPGLKKRDLNTSKAWTIKENFRWFWEYSFAFDAEEFFEQWHSWAIRSRLKPIIKVAKMINNHIENILTYFEHQITNAVSEGLNSRVQTIKAGARGFASFANFRYRILFFCGKLNLYPKLTH
jgi:transposase